jgi:PAS domain S-box-containing protein
MDTERNRRTESMGKTRVLIVEDEGITALDMKGRLEHAGYSVPATASSGLEAIAEAERTQPDLVLMDIRLQGEMDGIEAAGVIRARLDIPVVYLTAYADGETLQRAKVTEPYGYLIKPFEGRDVRTTIEMALYKHAMEKRLKQSERWLATTLRSIGDAVIATDAQGCIRLMNPLAEELTGWAEEEALGRKATEVFVVVDEEHRAPIENPVTTALRDNVPVSLPTPALLAAVDGTLIPIDDRTAPIRDDAGSSEGAVLVFRDITERMRAERALQRYTQGLQARNEELDAFAHTVAHDLKDPLSLVMGFSEVLAAEHTTMKSEEVQQYLDLIGQTGSKMLNIIDELLLLSDVRQREVHTEALDMAAIVTGAQFRLAHLVEEYQARVSRPETWPMAKGYAPWVEEVWVNYMSNALKYGGRPPHVELGAMSEGAKVRFWVRDDGPGIAPHVQDRLFRPFTRLDQTSLPGHGLGLSIVQRIVRKLGGEVGVESKGVPGLGSEFFFLLPQIDA